MRACRTCGETKPQMDFYSHTSGGLMRDCKECWKAYVKANRLARVEQYAAYERSRASLPHRVELRDRYAQTPEGREAGLRASRKFSKTPEGREMKKRWIAKNPVKRQAHNAAANAVRTGKLTRQPCEVCAAPKAQAHHDDYGKPLDVRWLCTKHHAEWHKHNTPICPQQEQAA